MRRALLLALAAAISVLDADFAQSLQPASAKSATVEGAGRSLSVRNLDPVPIAIPGQPPISVPAVAVSLEALSRQAGPIRTPTR